MTAPNLLFGRMLEFNFLPSRTLHHSRYETFEPIRLVEAVQAQPRWRAAWHRQWSARILQALNIGEVRQNHYPELVLGLLPPQSLTRLARRLGVLLSGDALRQTIVGEQVRALQDALGAELLDFARREVSRYDVDAAQRNVAAFDADLLSTLEKLGYGTMMAGVSQSPAEVARRVELKLPDGIQESDTPLSAAQAWRLCLAVLRDMDSTWCSYFPASR